MKRIGSEWIWRVGVVCSLAAAVAGFLPGERPVRAASSGDGAVVPVLVELFTSEGCSSCPPADALLAKLDAKQPVAGARVIVLSEHVTYWNRLGWRDPFSLDAMTERQQRYGERFGTGQVYTPQAVVDGATDVVGSDERGLERAIGKEIAQASSHPQPELRIEEARWSGDSVQFSVRGASEGKAMLTAVLAEDSVQSYVKRGENTDRNLRHVAVVRVLEEMGAGVEDGRGLSLRLPEEVAKSHGAMRLVVFLTDRGHGHVVAVEEKLLAP